jgi:antitoxin (DNA-binding transcriptional repressor) of toxin-antitoxin stability system
MKNISHRELHRQTYKILDRVKRGESIEIARNGEITGTLVPPSASIFERLLMAGQVRPATAGIVDFRTLPRLSSEAGTSEMLSSDRGDC